MHLVEGEKEFMKEANKKDTMIVLDKEQFRYLKDNKVLMITDDMNRLKYVIRLS